MFGRQELGSWVEHPWEVADPDDIEDSLNKLSHHDGTIGDVIWVFLFDLDPAEVQQNADRMKMALARYGRQSLLQWDDVEGSEIRKWYRVLKELLDTESAVTDTEDR